MKDSLFCTLFSRMKSSEYFGEKYDFYDQNCFEEKEYVWTYVEDRIGLMGAEIEREDPGGLPGSEGVLPINLEPTLWSWNAFPFRFKIFMPINIFCKRKWRS